MPADRPVTESREPVNLRCAVMVIRANAILLCRRTRETNTWVLPGGTPRPGEATPAAARREVAEETGLQVVAERVAYPRDDKSGYGAPPHRDRLHWCRGQPECAARTSRARSSTVIRPPRRTRPNWPPSTHRRIRWGYARSRRTRRDPRWSTAVYLGNVWRPDEGTSEPVNLG